MEVRGIANRAHPDGPPGGLLLGLVGPLAASRRLATLARRPATARYRGYTAGAVEAAE